MSSTLSVSVEDILSDLQSLSSDIQAQSSQRRIESLHPERPRALLSFGHSLLPDDLRTEERDTNGYDTGSQEAGRGVDEKELDELLARIKSDTIDESVKASSAVRLTQIYIALANSVLGLDGSNAGIDGKKDATIAQEGQFEQLHRRIARLQAKNDAEISRLEQIAASIQEA